MSNLLDARDAARDSGEPVAQYWAVVGELDLVLGFALPFHTMQIVAAEWLPIVLAPAVLCLWLLFIAILFGRAIPSAKTQDSSDVTRQPSNLTSPRSSSDDATAANARSRGSSSGQTTAAMIRLDGAFTRLERWSLGGLLRRRTSGDELARNEALDAYVGACVLVAVVAYVLLSAVPAHGALVWLFMPWVAYRLVEIFGVYGNALLFDPARWTRQTSLEYKTRSAERTLAQYIVLFLETTALFGLGYFALRSRFDGLRTALDGLAQSLGVMTSSGWPYQPQGEWRFVPLAEVLYGFLIALTVLARAVGSLRLVGGLDRDPQPTPRAPGDPGEG